MELAISSSLIFVIGVLSGLVISEKATFRKNKNRRTVDIKQKQELPKPPPIFKEEHNLRMEQRFEKLRHQKELEDAILEVNKTVREISKTFNKRMKDIKIQNEASQEVIVKFPSVSDDALDSLRYAFDKKISNDENYPLLEILVKDMNSVPSVKYKGKRINPDGIVGVKFNYQTLDNSINMDQGYRLEYIPKNTEGKWPDIITVEESKKDLLRK